MTELKLQDVHSGYGRTRVVNGITVSIGAQQTVALLGPNGSGKSTVAKTIMSLTRQYEGRIEWCGQDVTSMPSWRRVALGIGYVPQVDNVFRSMSVNDNLLVGLGRASRLERRARLAEIYDLFPRLEERADMKADKLSGGERRLLAFATTLTLAPQLLVLDEPTSDLAPAAIDLVFDKIYEARQRLKIPVLLIEQNVGRALELADVVYILIRGKIVVRRPASGIDEKEIGGIFLERAER